MFLRKCISVVTTARPLIMTKASSSISGTRLLSTNRVLMSDNQAKEDLQEKIVLTDDGRVVVCWHPEVPCAYEHTRPIPLEVASTDSVLKVQALLPVREVFRQKPQRMIINELMNLTYTAKPGWYPKRRRVRYMEYERRKEEKNREYL